jgi:alkaline phosphatase D
MGVHRSDRGREPLTTPPPNARLLVVISGLLLIAGFVQACDGDEESATPTVTSTGSATVPREQGFDSGVAAGAVSETTATLWTRFEGDAVTGQVSASEEFDDIVTEESLVPEQEADFTIHWLVEGLEPDTSYFYRFLTDDGSSPVGSFATAPDPDDEASFSFVMSGDADGTRDASGNPSVNGFEIFDTMRADEPALLHLRRRYGVCGLLQRRGTCR